MTVSVLIADLESRLRSVRTAIERIDALNELSWELRRQDPERAKILADSAYQQAQDNEYVMGIAHSLGNLARLAHYTGSNGEAVDICRHSLEQFEKVDESPKSYFLVLHTLSMSLRLMGDYPASLDVCLKMQKESANTSFDDIKAFALNGIANCMRRLGDFEKAIGYYQDCLKLCDTINYDLLLPAVHINLATTYRSIDDPETSLHHAQNALQAAHRTEDSDMVISAMSELGETYLAMRSYDDVIVHMQSVLDQLTHSSIYTNRHKQVALYVIGKALTQKQHYVKALPYLKEALAIAEQIDVKKRQYECYEQLAQCYEGQGDLSTALAHFREFHRIKEEVFSEENYVRVNNLITLHQTETARKEAEIQRQLLEQERARYNELSEMKDKIIASTSHDLKNPLASMILQLRLFRYHLASDPKGLSYVDRLESIVGQMRHLITDVLDLARLQTGQALKHEAMPIVPFVGDVVKDHTTGAIDKNISLRFDPRISNVISQFDPLQMRRVLDNLISNAIKYTPSGGIVEVIVEQGDQSLTIHVIDNGPGIADKELAKIFDSFYRIQDGPQREQDGTGLGLAIVKTIVEQHNGSVHVQSAINHGSTFSISLPLS